MKLRRASVTVEDFSTKDDNNNNNNNNLLIIVDIVVIFIGFGFVLELVNLWKNSTDSLKQLVMMMDKVQ